MMTQSKNAAGVQMFTESDDLTLNGAMKLLVESSTGHGALDLAVLQTLRRHAPQVPVLWRSAFTCDVRKARKLIPAGWKLCSTASYPSWCSAHFVRKNMLGKFAAELRPEEIASATRSYMGNTEALAVCIGALDLTRQLVEARQAEVRDVRLLGEPESLALSH